MAFSDGRPDRFRAWQRHSHGLHVGPAPALAAAGQHERVDGGVQAAQLVLADVPRQHADPRQQVALLRACEPAQPSAAGAWLWTKLLMWTSLLLHTGQCVVLKKLSADVMAGPELWQCCAVIFKSCARPMSRTRHAKCLRRPRVHAAREVAVAVVGVRQQRQGHGLRRRELLQERRQKHVPALALLPLEHLHNVSGVFASVETVILMACKAVTRMGCAKARTERNAKSGRCRAAGSAPKTRSPTGSCMGRASAGSKNAADTGSPTTTSLSRATPDAAKTSCAELP